MSHRTKLYTALAVVIGGIVWTTVEKETSTGNPANAQEVVRASMPAPTFFFDDAVDALTAHFSSEKEQPEAAAVTFAAPIDTAKQVAITRPASLAEPTDQGLTNSAAPSDPLHPLMETTETAVTKTLSPLVDHPALTAVLEDADTPEDTSTIVVAVAPGNTLSGILNKHGVNIDQMPGLLTDDTVKQHLSNLRIGQELEIQQLPDGNFQSLTTRVGDDKRITINRSDSNFEVVSIDLPLEKERVVTSGTIQQSLYLAAQQADLKQSTIMELADIFQWELDFAKDIRKGDQFSLVYDRLYRDGRYIGDGDILAAEFIRGGKNYRAIRFTTDDGSTGYYSPDGKSMRRTFMRHPVDVVRITSRFNPNRLHPVLHQIRAHRGVDYGSPIGSPIYATADGKVTYSGMKGAYGNTVVLQHGKKFSTLYAHMSKISEKAAAGARVRQGDVVGYVGKTGRVTGAHLHYEFRVNNMQIDPLKVELPAAPPIEGKYLAELKALSDEMTAQMRSVLPAGDQQVASANNAIVSSSTTPTQP
ncbi:peptidoglycan DD-metalloendopeptidase family protein [Granulosicoccus sp. 3-233]|uniref:peptidoglycan DD-metalloendopeptidase family protein n=1 Tax=Granulosicoccus sp. 3-233 TaxID=3417969 RepID=UPI003D34EA70